VHRKFFSLLLDVGNYYTQNSTDVAELSLSISQARKVIKIAMHSMHNITRHSLNRRFAAYAFLYI